MTTNQSLLQTAEREFHDLDEGLQDYSDFHNATKRFVQGGDVAERRPRNVHDYSKLKRFSNGELNNSCRRSKNDNIDIDEILGSGYVQVKLRNLSPLGTTVNVGNPNTFGFRTGGYCSVVNLFEQTKLSEI